MAESLLFAAPVHFALDKTGKDLLKIKQLVRYNFLRLLTSALGSLIVLFLLLGQLN
jgi:copper homeostasis protein CutC